MWSRLANYEHGVNTKVQFSAFPTQREHIAQVAVQLPPNSNRAAGSVCQPTNNCRPTTENSVTLVGKFGRLLLPVIYLGLPCPVPHFNDAPSRSSYEPACHLLTRLSPIFYAHGRRRRLNAYLLGDSLRLRCAAAQQANPARLADAGDEADVPVHAQGRRPHQRQRESPRPLRSGPLSYRLRRRERRTLRLHRD